MVPQHSTTNPSSERQSSAHPAAARRDSLNNQAEPGPLGNTPSAPLGSATAKPTAKPTGSPSHSYWGKRALDVVAASAGLLILSPLLILLALLVRWRLGSPVLFCQVRPGLGGRPFTMYKFRTMRDAVDNRGQPLSDAERLTRLGKFLRAASLDELPELWNVLRGEMSLVGPRPLLMEYLSLYSPEQARRHEVRPGVTGWAQVNGRNAISWQQKFEYDVWYVDHVSFPLDLKILGLTLVKVLRRSGISQEGQATMEKFRGGEAPALPVVDPSCGGKAPALPVDEPSCGGEAPALPTPTTKKPDS